jgi:hypothetical protein
MTDVEDVYMVHVLDKLNYKVFLFITNDLHMFPGLYTIPPHPSLFFVLQVDFGNIQNRALSNPSLWTRPQ